MGKLVHDNTDCKTQCDASVFLTQLSDLIESFPRGETVLSEATCLAFMELASTHISLFIVFDQLNKQFDAQLYNLHPVCFKTAATGLEPRTT